MPLLRSLKPISLIAAALFLASTTRAQDLQENPFDRGVVLYYFEKDFQGALEAYKLMPEDHPNYPTAQRYIGHNIYGREWGQWEQAVPSVEEAYRAAPNDPKVLEDIGRVYLKVGRISEGIELLERADTWVSRRALAELKEGT